MEILVQGAQSRSGGTGMVDYDLRVVPEVEWF